MCSTYPPIEVKYSRHSKTNQDRKLNVISSVVLQNRLFNLETFSAKMLALWQLVWHTSWPLQTVLATLFPVTMGACPPQATTGTLSQCLAACLIIIIISSSSSSLTYTGRTIAIPASTKACRSQLQARIRTMHSHSSSAKTACSKGSTTRVSSVRAARVSSQPRTRVVLGFSSLFPPTTKLRTAQLHLPQKVYTSHLFIVDFEALQTTNSRW